MSAALRAVTLDALRDDVRRNLGVFVASFTDWGASVDIALTQQSLCVTVTKQQIIDGEIDGFSLDESGILVGPDGAKEFGIDGNEIK